MYSAPYVNVSYMSMNTKVPAVVTANDDGGYSIFLNSRLTREQQTDAYIHELGHILMLDFDVCHDNVDSLEFFAHRVDSI